MTDPAVTCPQCGALHSQDLDRCWLCDTIKTDSNPFAAPVADERNSKPPAFVKLNQQSFSLSTLLAVFTLTAVYAGVTVQAPGIGFVLAIVSVPALVRTIGIGRRKKKKGQRLNLLEKAGAFFGSLVVVVVIATASFISFVVICFPVGLVGFNMPGASAVVAFAFLLGIVVAVVVGIFLIRRLWWRKR